MNNSYTCRDHGHDWEYTGVPCNHCGGKLCRTECVRVGCGVEENECVRLMVEDQDR